MIVESIIIVTFALLLDFAFGDPKNRYHPTAWIGTLIAKLTPLAKNQNTYVEKLGGIFVVTITVGVVVVVLSILDIGISLITTDWASLIVSVISGIILLKSTIAIRGMERYALSV
ncbi:MAG: cobalamin biosynthesis protein, partial [Nitrosopumilus sp.]|nr:cobalamin biosynthesis protein [Nitrosopumilus sp.]